MKTRIYDKRLSPAKSMPPMYRTQPGCEYNTEADEVMAWVMKDAAMQAWLIETLARIGYIQYDKGAGKWRGIDYGD